MPLTIPTLTGLIPYKAEQALRLIAAAVDRQEADLSKIPRTPPPLTLAQIRNALGATGSTPLNVFNLFGGGVTATGGAIALGTHGSRVALSPAAAGEGATWYETDRHVMYGVLAGAWQLLGSFGLRGTLSPDQKPADLGGADAEFMFVSTDFWRTYRWTGAAWDDAPGEDDRLFLQYFNVAPGHAGWQLCDGSTVPQSKADGTTANVTVPDLITANRFIRSANAAGGTGGAASATTGNNSANVVVMAGVGTTVAADPHTHSVATLPPYYEALPYMRL